MRKNRRSILPLILFCLFGLLLTFGGCASTSEVAETPAPPEATPTAPSTVMSPSPRTLTAEEAYEFLFYEDSVRVLLDVRTEEEFQEMHIPGARLIPLQELQERVLAELLDKDIPILIYCRSGRRSAEAALLLMELGYLDVFDIGGINDWPFEVIRPE